MARPVTYLRNTDHVIAHRQNATLIENARRSAMARDMRRNSFSITFVLAHVTAGLAVAAALVAFL